MDTIPHAGWCFPALQFQSHSDCQIHLEEKSHFTTMSAIRGETSPVFMSFLQGS